MSSQKRSNIQSGQLLIHYYTFYLFKNFRKDIYKMPNKILLYYEILTIFYLENNCRHYRFFKLHSWRIERRPNILGIFLELCKAFDLLDQKIIISKLYRHGIRGLPLLWFQKYLCPDRFKLICYSFHWKGSSLEPLLFIVNINVLISSDEFRKLILFANVTCLLVMENTLDALKRLVSAL